MSESRGMPPEDFNFEAHNFRLNRAEQTEFDLLDTQEAYLRQLTVFADFPYDSDRYSEDRQQLVSLGDDMYWLLHERVDQIIHERESYDMPPKVPIIKLLSRLDAQQIAYFDEHHPAPIPAQPLSTDQAKRLFDRISSKGLDLSQTVVQTHAKRTHQHLGHYLLGRAVSEWHPTWHIGP